MPPGSCSSAFDWSRDEYESKALIQKDTTNRSRVKKDDTKAMIELGINRGSQWSQFGLKWKSVRFHVFRGSGTALNHVA